MVKTIKMGAQLLQVQLVLDVGVALEQSGSAVAVDGDASCSIDGNLVIDTTIDAVHKQTGLDLDIMGRGDKFAVLRCGNAHLEGDDITIWASADLLNQIQAVGRNDGGRGVGGQQAQRIGQQTHLALHRDGLKEQIRRDGLSGGVHGDEGVHILLLTRVQPVQQSVQTAQLGAVFHGEGVVLDQLAAVIHKPKLAHIESELLGPLIRLHRESGCRQKAHQHAGHKQQAQNPFFHFFSPPLGIAFGLYFAIKSSRVSFSTAIWDFR